MTLPSISQHSKLHGIVPSKKLGQNFLFDLSLCEKIVRGAGDISGKIVLEIGPGPGGLTRAILNAKPARLIVIEKDARCNALIEDIISIYPELELMHEDALDIKLKDVIARSTEDATQQSAGIISHSLAITIIANLPYNIGTELIFRWLEEIEYVESITVMLQKEVVDRICAKPGSKTYGKLSVMCQLMASAEKLFDVSREAFYPPPKVTSSIVRLVPRENPPSKEIIEKIRNITHLAFSARRKMIKSSLQKLVPNIDKLLSDASISSTLRAENLSVEDYLKLATLSKHII
jgi:16S rRNA (adenine1518-N6/adenine1519-N6)-dimethyltransferase